MAFQAYRYSKTQLKELKILSIKYSIPGKVKTSYPTCLYSGTCLKVVENGKLCFDLTRWAVFELCQNMNYGSVCGDMLYQAKRISLDSIYDILFTL